jgi:CRP/FNR family cyclic AMP-dependent transcriptional regulator
MIGVDPAGEVAAALAGIPMFRHLGARRRVRLARLCCRRRYPSGAVVVRQGDTSLSLYVVLSGAVRIIRHGTGDAVTIVEEGPGSCFGEMGLIDDLPRAATVVAVEPTECALLARWDFQPELAADPGIALALVSVLTARIRTLDDRLADLSSPAPVRP